MTEMEFIFDKDGNEPVERDKPAPWHILVVDDSPDVVTVTKAVLNGAQFLGREILVFSAHSASEARRLLESQVDIAVALIDVVMETDDAGLRLITAIRDELHLRAMRIILRTGQPGIAPERDIICQYDINDYRLKTELTAHSLFIAVVAGLRGYSEINARIAAEQEVLLAARSKSDFLATISHELRTPLNAIIGFADILTFQSTYSAPPESTFELLQEIKTNGHLLLAMINRLINMASIDSGRYQLREEEVVVEDLLNGAISSASDRASATGLTLIAQQSPDIKTIYADATALMQVFDNLLSNAIKFSPKGGRIVLFATLSNDRRPMIIVADQGIGIPADRLNSLFRPFAQIDTGFSRHFEGIGLGLAIVKGLVTLHGGTVDVSSTEDVGTRMAVLLPPWRLLSPTPCQEATSTDN